MSKTFANENQPIVRFTAVCVVFFHNFNLYQVNNTLI